MNKIFSETEKNILNIFKKDVTFLYKDVTHTIEVSGKPLVKKGECKTDIYIQTVTPNKKKHEFKISIKQDNADFLENKITSERALQIFGPNASEIISNAINTISDKFKTHKLIEFKKKGPTIMLGWKFELMNKLSGKKSGEIKLNLSQINDIYSGKNLDKSKKNAYVNGIEIKNSGVSEYILIIKPGIKKTPEQYFYELQKIEDFVKGKKIYFSCKALNYRVNEKKWDGDRPLCVWVNWHIKEKLLHSELVFNNPLETKGNIVGNKIENILSDLKLNANNFENIKKYYS